MVADLSCRGQTVQARQEPVEKYQVKTPGAGVLAGIVQERESLFCIRNGGAGHAKTAEEGFEEFAAGGVVLDDEGTQRTDALGGCGLPMGLSALKFERRVERECSSACNLRRESQV